MKVLAIDPGNIESAYCIIDSETLRPESFGKVPNLDLIRVIGDDPDMVVIERVASYGMAVGRDVFETCEWVGQYTACARMVGVPVDYVYRQDEKLHICLDSRAKDSNVQRALIDRFAQHDLKRGKGTKKNKDWFYGFAADVWAAYAVGLTWIETKMTDAPRGNERSAEGIHSMER